MCTVCVCVRSCELVCLELCGWRACVLIVWCIKWNTEPPDTERVCPEFYTRQTYITQIRLMTISRSLLLWVGVGFAVAHTHTKRNTLNKYYVYVYVCLI